MKFKIKAELTQNKLDMLNEDIVREFEFLSEREVSELADFIESGDKEKIDTTLVTLEYKLGQILSKIKEYLKEELVQEY